MIPAMIPRAIRITWVAVLGGLSSLLGLWRTRGLPDDERRLARETLAGQVLRQTCENFGATFVKFGQVLSTRADLLPAATIAELRRLQDELPAFPYSEVARTIREDLGKEVDELFRSFDHQPLAAASVAQVHRAVDHEGRSLAVKVLRPGVRAQAENDIAVLKVLARIASWHPTLRLSDPRGLAEHLSRGLLAQTDLHTELAHAERFQKNFEDFEGVFFPRTYADRCSARVLTMQFIEGTKVDELGPGDHSDIGRVLLQAFLKMCFRDGFVHADLHPGNMRVTPDRRVAIFDLGLAEGLSDRVLEEFLDVSKCVVMGGADDVIAHMKTFHHYIGEVDWDEVRGEVAEFVDRFRSQSVTDLEVGVLFNEMFALGRKYKIQPLTDTALVIVGLITSEGVGKMLNPDANSFQDIANYLMPIMMERGMTVLNPMSPPSNNRQA